MSKEPRQKPSVHIGNITGIVQSISQTSHLFRADGPFSTKKSMVTLPGLGDTFSAFSQVGSALKSLSATISIFEKLDRHMTKFRKALEEHENELPKVLAVMIEHSWYPDFEFDLFNMRQLEEPARLGDIGAMEVLLTDHFHDRRKSLEQELVTAFPAREKPLAEAFEVYDAEKYLLAIPVFLAQADGISMALLDSKNFFSYGKSEEPAKRRKNSEVGSYARILLEPLVQRGTLRTGTDRLKNIAFDFNRHGIMHGIVSDYGTRVNALKAISLLAYLYSLTER